MTIKIFNEIFINKHVDKKSMIIVEFILIISLFLIILFNQNFYNYYNGKGEIKDNILSTLVLTDDIDVIKSNNEIRIDEDLYAYEIQDIENETYISNGYVYKIVNIKISNYKDINNNYIDYQIIKEKDTILNYFINTLKGG